MSSPKFPDQNPVPNMNLFMAQKEIQKMLNDLAEQINRDYAGKRLVLIGVLKGCLPFLNDLASKITTPILEIDFVRMRYILDNTSENTIRLEQDISINLYQKHALIVTEIIDTGKMLYFLKQRLHLTEAHSIKLATLFDKQSQRSTSIEPDYRGQLIEPEFLVGYGLDLEEFGRNNEDIYRLKTS